MKKYFWKISGFLVGLFLIFLVVREIGWDLVLESFSRFSWIWIIPSLGIYLLSWFFRVLLLESLVNFYKARISKKLIFLTTISGYALNVVVPAKGGDFLRVVYFRKFISLSKSLVVVIQSRILDLLGLVVVFVPFLLLAPGFDLSDWGGAFFLPLGLILVLVLFLVFGRSKLRLVEKGLEFLVGFLSKSFLKKVSIGFKRLVLEYKELMMDKRLFLKTVFLATLVWFFEALTALLLSVGLGGGIGIVPLVLAVSLANVAKVVPATPGGLGFYEAVFTVVLGSFGVDAQTALSLAVIDHFMKHGLVLIIGLPATNWAVKFLKVDRKKLEI